MWGCRQAAESGEAGVIRAKPDGPANENSPPIG